MSDLIAELKKLNISEEQKSLNKMKELVKGVAPVVMSKLKKLISNRVKQVHQDSVTQTQQIKCIANVVQLFNDQHQLT